MIERILDKDATVSTSAAEMFKADEDFRTAFETSDRLLREASFKLENSGGDTYEPYEIKFEPIEDKDSAEVVDIQTQETIGSGKVAETRSFFCSRAS